MFTLDSTEFHLDLPHSTFPLISKRKPREIEMYWLLKVFDKKILIRKMATDEDGSVCVVIELFGKYLIEKQ